MKPRRRAAPLPASPPAPPAPPARATVLVVNEALGHVDRYGFPSLTRATEYAITQAVRSQPFVVFRVLHGAPKDHGPPVDGFVFRGNPRLRDDGPGHDAASHVARLLEVAGARALVDVIAQRHGAEVAHHTYEVPTERDGGPSVLERRHFVSLDRRPNRWRETWCLASADGATEEEALAALAADLFTGNPASPCTACGRQCGAFVATAPRAFDSRTEQAGRVVGPRAVLCTVCLNGSIAVEDMER